MKKIALISLALVLAMGTLGVGYAMWSKSLVINGTVHTGEVNAEFTVCFTDDDGTPNDANIDPNDDGGPNPFQDPHPAPYDHWGFDSSCDPDASQKVPPRKDKDVGRSTASISTEDAQYASLLIENAYPCYYTTAYYKLVNTGTVPVKIQAVYEHCSVDHWVSYNYNPANPGAATWEYHAGSTWYEVTPCVVKAIDFDNDGDPELNVHVTGIAVGDQIDKDGFVWMDIDVHVKQDAKELAGVDDSGIPAYTFDEKVYLVQWNEYTPPSP